MILRLTLNNGSRSVPAPEYRRREARGISILLQL